MTVQVQPSLLLGRNNGWIVHASASCSFAGCSAQIQRLNGATGQWVTLTGAAELRRRPRHADAKGVNWSRVTIGQPGGAGYLASGPLTRQPGVGARGAECISPRAPQRPRLRPS